MQKESHMFSGLIVPLSANPETAARLYYITKEANGGRTTWKESSFLYELENENNFYLGYEIEGEIVGYIGCMRILDELSINNFAVLPHQRRQGIGLLLLTEMIRMNVAAGVRHFYLEVRVSNESAISLYEKVGFEKISFRKEYYVDPVEDAYVFYKQEPDLEVDK